ncbi:prepilin peptidase [Candidatus Woesearchaeota archaeon]|nr:prepilin peptidase [Candidatus Woesearchaeota archaeon]MCF7901511.1 prepilin peptidase [Candidatus Woesearchaeota archaeon]MCF8013938.1 prepilin peptidase [Candidatus Woesearchaeota archaeon]
MDYIYVVHGVAIVGLFLGSLVDLKKREVPDTVNYILLAIGLLFGVILSVIYGDVNFIIASVLGYVVCNVLGLLLFYLGQWGGGDTKALRGIGALVGLPLLTIGVVDSFLLSFVVTLLFSGALWGIFWVIYLMLKHKKAFLKEYLILRKDDFFVNKKYYFLLVFFIFISLSFIFGLNPFFNLVLIIVFAFTYFMLFFRIVAKAIENSAMVVNIPVSKLVEGDWIVGELKLKNGSIFESPKTGLEEKDIILLKKNFTHVSVREGVPFIPSFFIAYVFCVFVGPWVGFIF